jgi:drug/metabolite transporter (DMT)-like permease
VTTVPLWMALFGWMFLRIAPSLTTLLGILVAVAGGATIAFGDAGGGTASAPLLGDALALIGAISVTGYLMLGRTVQRAGIGLNAYVGAAYGVAAFLLLPLPAVFGLSYGGYPVETYAWIALLALVPQLIGHTGINFAMKHLDPTFVSTTLLLEPVGAALLALALFGEVPSVLTIVGACVLLAGLAMTVRARGSSQPARGRTAG